MGKIFPFRKKPQGKAPKGLPPKKDPMEGINALVGCQHFQGHLAGLESGIYEGEITQASSGRRVEISILIFVRPLE